MIPAPDVSIVIPVYGNWWLTRRCLNALAALRDQTTVRFETVVVDNASPDDTALGLDAFEWIRRIDLTENANFSGGCNAGAREARGKVILFLNNDALPIGDPIAPLVRAFDDPAIVIAGGIMQFEDGPVQCAGLAMQAGAAWWSLLRNTDAALAPRAAPPLCPTGAAFAVRAEWFHEVGGFDESYRNGYEDVDLAMRARRSGKRAIVLPQVRFFHYEGASANRFAYEQENERRFYSTWHAELNDVPRIERGRFGAFILRNGSRNPLVARTLATLLPAIRNFGHPVVERVTPWTALDTRFRRGNRVHLEWFTQGNTDVPALRVNEGVGPACIRVAGEIETTIPFLPCVERDAPCALSFSPQVKRVAAIGLPPALLKTLQERFAGYEVVDVAAAALLERDRIEVALAVVSGLTDATAYGNVLLALNGIPMVALGENAKRLFFDDTCVFSTPEAIAESLAELLKDRDRRVELSATGREDALRRFSPARSAMRLIDNAFYARNGLERTAASRSNVPSGVEL